MSRTKVLFGDVVRKVNKKVDPIASGIERYVAGEHMDTDEARIHRFGIVGDGYLGPAFHMLFEPGHILYGSRRTYLRKVAMADFSGVCANTTFVLEPSSEDLDRRYLLYVMSTERFHQNSISLSKGSTNPYINFSDLASYEFELPSLDEQARLVELISEIDEQITRIEALIESGNRVVSAIIDDSLYKVSSPWSMSNLDEVCKNGLFNDGDWVESKDQDPAGENRLLQLADIGTLKFLDKSDRWMNNEQFKRLRCTELLEKDVLIARMPDPIGRACLMPSGQPRSATVVDVSIARPDQSIVIPEYLVLAVNGPKFHQAVVTNTVGTTRPRIARSKLGKIEFPLPPLPKQISIVDRVDEAMAQIEKAETARLATFSLRTSLINSELS